MPLVTGITATKSEEIEQKQIASAAFVGGKLVLTKEDATVIETGEPTFTNAHIAANAAISRTKIAAPEAPRIVGAGGQPAFQNSWTALTTGGYEPVAFWRDTNTQMVYIRGLIQNAANPAANSTVFTLPVGYRPSGSVVVFVTALNSGAFIPVFITITTTGLVQVGSDLAAGCLIYLGGGPLMGFKAVV